MKTVICSIATLLLMSWSVAPAARATEDAAGAAQQQTENERPRKKSYKGRITAIDVGAGTITVRTHSSIRTFSVGPDVPIRTLHKPKAALADLKRGDWVNVRFLIQGQTNVATRINHASEMMAVDDLEPPNPPRK